MKFQYSYVLHIAENKWQGHIHLCGHQPFWPAQPQQCEQGALAADSSSEIDVLVCLFADYLKAAWLWAEQGCQKVRAAGTLLRQGMQMSWNHRSQQKALCKPVVWKAACITSLRLYSLRRGLSVCQDCLPRAQSASIKARHLSSDAP